MHQSLVLPDLLQLIDEPNRTYCLALWKRHDVRFALSPGALFKHQAWQGGYLDHLEQGMNLACALYPVMQLFQPLPFSLSDALLVFFLHDLEKPFKYVEPKKNFKDETEEKNFVEALISESSFILTDEHQNALKYIHGEGEDYSPVLRVQGPLAAFTHMCDVASARIWYDYP
jgi:hypothetical protein